MPLTLELSDDQLRALAREVARILPKEQPSRTTHPASPPEFYTVGEAAEILKLHPRSVARRVQAGAIKKASGFVRAIRIPASEIVRLTEKAS